MDNKETFQLFRNIKYIFKEYFRFDKLLILLPAITIPVSVADSLLVIYLTKVVLDGVESKQAFVLMALRICLITASMMLLRGLRIRLGWAANYRNYKANLALFRRALDYKATDMDYEAFASPEGKNKYSKAVIAVVGNFGNSVGEFFPSIVQLATNAAGFAAFVAIIMTLNPWIVLLLLLSYSLDSIIAYKIDKSIYKLKDQRAAVRLKLDYILNTARDTAASKDIRLYSMNDWLYKLSKAFGNQHIGFEKKANRKSFLHMLLEAAIILVRDSAAYIYLVYKMLQGNMSIGDFSVYLAAILGFGNWLSGIIYQISNLLNSNREIIDFRSFVELQDSMNREAGAKRAEPASPLEIEFSKVSFSYPQSDKLILDQVSFTIHKGERIAIVGNNGAGKTTLVMLMCGLLRPTSGDIYLDGINIRDYNRDDCYEMISTIFQDMCFLPASIAKNVSLCEESELDRERLFRCFETAGIREKIEKLPKQEQTMLIKTVFDHATELSGGEKQKLLLARALYNNAPLLILDEPTAALDPIAENDIYMKYSQITENNTSIFISHRLSSTSFCDRILFLDSGAIVESGTHEELIKLGGKYAEMFAMQSYYYNLKKVV